MKKWSVLMVLVMFLSIIALPAQAEEDISDLIKRSGEEYRDGRLDQSLLLMQEVVEIIWQDSPIWVATQKLVSQPAEGFGMYKPRPHNRYKAGEKVLIYCEPMGFHHLKGDDGIYRFHMVADFSVRDAKGEILGGQKGFGNFQFASQRANRELFISLTYNFTGFTPGKYVIESVINDIYGKTNTKFETEIVME